MRAGPDGGRASSAPGARSALIAQLGEGVSRFQEATHGFDELAAEILAVQRADLPCMTALLFGGASTVDALAAALHRRRGDVKGAVDRLQLAGYARLAPGQPRSIELTEHARAWIERIWAPLWTDGQALLASYRTPELAVLASFLPRACAIQEDRGRRLRSWLAVPSSPARRPHLRGGLSPAALRRVQLFVEAHLARPIRLVDSAGRAALSTYHFARAFKLSVGSTPRAFVESRRMERAKRLLLESDLSLSEVAVACGLGHQSRLTSTFKRRTGFTPGAYRRGHDRPG